MVNEIGSQSASTSESKPLGQEKVHTPAATVFNEGRSIPNLPLHIDGPRENYMLSVPLYEASIKCDWKAAKAILDEKPDLVRYSITTNGETALHVAVSVKRNKHVGTFVKNLVDMMEAKDLELQNQNFSTAFYLAAVAGNIIAVKIMMGKNERLLTIPSGRQVIMFPLFAAAVFGNYDVVKYLYENSNDLSDEETWTNITRGWFLQNCVATDMFDIALKVVKRYPELSSTSGLLGILAAKPEAFPETKSSIIEKPIKLIKGLYSRRFITHQQPKNMYLEPVSEDLDQKPEAKSNVIGRSIKSVLTLIGLTSGASEKEREAIHLLRYIWDGILKMQRKEIDNILIGPPDSTREGEKLHSERLAKVLQLIHLINKHLDKLEVETENIVKEQPNATHQDIESSSGKIYKALQLRKLVSEYILNMPVETENLSKKDNKPDFDVGDQALKLQNLIWKHTVSMHEETEKVFKFGFRRETITEELQKVIYYKIKNMREELKRINTGKQVATYSSRVLFIAAEMNNTVFLVELIRGYPDLIWNINDNGHSIFHIGVKHRNERIYNLLYEIGSMKDLVTPLTDENGNNMLHLVGMMSMEKTLADVSGAALRMQRELLWFKEVKTMVPPSYRKLKNKDGMSPQELFTKEHKELVIEGEKWMKETASQCMVVAALIATIVFAAAFTIPGGYNQTDGIPIFYQKSMFVAFVVADALSLFLSSASILTFLSILTSRYVERDFEKSLPKKLLLGVSTLFLSIIAMMITFSVSFFILYHGGMKWIPIMIGGVALMPVILYIVLQYHVLIDIFRSIYGSKFLFKPGKQFLYYVNPKV